MKSENPWLSSSPTPHTCTLVQVEYVVGP